MENVIKLIEGNERYVKNGKSQGDFSESRRDALSAGQKPFAAVLACADSRVIPEIVFDRGLGDLFVVRCAGNVVGDVELASLEYAVLHLGVKTVVVLGHTNCGAVGAAIHGEFEGNIGVITRKIRKIIGDEKDTLVACKANVLSGAAYLRATLPAEIVPAVYDIKSGKVIFLDRR